MPSYYHEEMERTSAFSRSARPSVSIAFARGPNGIPGISMRLKFAAPQKLAGITGSGIGAGAGGAVPPAFAGGAAK